LAAEVAVVTQTVRLPDELAERLERLVGSTKRSKSSYIVEAIERYLEECEDLEVALSRFRDPDAEWVEHDDVRRELGLD
jgi:predicted DNA-binding protein